MIVALRGIPGVNRDWRQLTLAVAAGLACALAIAKHYR